MIRKFQCNHPKIGKRVFIAPSSDIIGNVSIGDDSSIWFNVVIRGDENNINIGSNVSIQDLSMLHITHYEKEDRSDGYELNIGDNTTIAHKVMLHGCTIGDNCLIGMSATILDGAIIGNNCIVGANSLVTAHKTFEENSMIMGSPAKVIRKLTPQEIQNLKNHAMHYVKLKDKYLNE